MGIENEVESSTPPRTEDKLESVYVPGPNAVDVTELKDGGILKEIIKEGEGDDYPLDGEKVAVHYVGRLQDGQIFDSSRERGEQFEFVLGKGAVIKGWEIGVATMQKGEVAMLTCQPDYAYGKTGMSPKIPENATLVFEVELIDWQLEDLTSKKDLGVLRRILAKGEGFVSPNDGALVEVHVTGKFNGKTFEDRDVSFCLGEGGDIGIVEGIEVALQKFKNKEKSLLKLSSKYAFGKVGEPDMGIPPDAPQVEYEVTLNNFEKSKEPWEMDSKEKMEQAEISKNKGTAFFKAGKYRQGIKQYKRINSFLEFETNLKDEKKEARDSLVIVGFLNLAMCYIKINDYVEAIKACERALEKDPSNAKGLFRRGQARLAINDYEEAKHDFEDVLKVEPNNKAAKNQLIQCTNKIREYRDKERRTYRSMFLSISPNDVKSSNNKVETGVWEDDKTHSEVDSSVGDANDNETISF